ncbi:MAG: hypothetical protein LBV30_00535 [Propionibacteriaceae bacterium]|nr:hypothetical protein [Propionibacteriaceae bacterium]
MVATLLSLKFHLTIADLRRSPARTVFWIIGLVYAVAMMALVIWGLTALSWHVDGHFLEVGAITVTVGSLITLCWVLLPLVFFGADQTLDPSRFSLFPLTGRQLAPGLALAGLLGIPGAITAVVALASALPWLHRPLVLVIGVIGGALAWLTTQLWCRTASSALAASLSSRKSRDMAGLIGVVLVILLSFSSFAIQMIIRSFTNGGDWQQALSVLDNLARVLSWTPLGAPWALVGDAGRGQWLWLAGHALVSLIYLALGFFLFAKVLDKALATPAAEAASSQIAKGDAIAKAANWFWVRPATVPVAAIVARCLRYWRRDPRYLTNVPMLILMPALFVVMSKTVGNPEFMGADAGPAWIGSWLVAFGLGLTGLMAGYSLSADTASDSTAWWLHLAAGVRGWQDRLGRAIAALWMAPYLAVITVVAAVVLGWVGRLPALIACVEVLFLVALGVSSIFSALIIYPVPLPGESPLRTRTGMMGAQMLSQFGSMLIAGVAALPICIWAIFSHGLIDWLLLLVGLIWGIGLLVAGVAIGGRVMDGRGPAILATLVKNDNRLRA